MRRIMLMLSAGLSLGLIACSASGGAPTAGSPVTTLDATASQLRADFNHAHGTVRLLFLVDPICPGCLRGMDDVNRALLAGTRDPHLQTFVVYESVLGGKAGDIPAAAKLLHNTHVHAYWDPSGGFGREVTRSLGLQHQGKPVYAWDVWMIYAADTVMPQQGVPPPTLFMHQLAELMGQPGRPFLDADVYAATAHTLLAHLPSSAAAKQATHE